jgi:hypothetical protein
MTQKTYLGQNGNKKTNHALKEKTTFKFLFQTHFLEYFLGSLEILSSIVRMEIESI